MADLQFPKKELFVFDKVVLLELRSLMGDMRASGHDLRLRQADELEWLLDAGLVVEHDFTAHVFNEEVERELNLAAAEQQRLFNSIGQYLASVGPSFPGGAFPPGVADMSLFWNSTERLARAAAIQWGAKRDIEAVPVLSTEQLNSSKREGLATADVVQIVLDSVPIPEDFLPLHDFLAFRAEPETREQLLGLRRWMRKAATGTVGAVELAEEVEWLLAQYRKYMDISSIKYTMGTLESTIKLASSVVQNLVTLRFEEIAKTYFSLKRSKVELLEAEMKAPGRELAYLVRASSRFRADGQIAPPTSG